VGSETNGILYPNEKVKFEGVNEALAFANNSKYMYKFDLKSGYHHIDIHEHHQLFFRFFMAVWQQN
jgi:hypothetical protein